MTWKKQYPPPERLVPYNPAWSGRYAQLADAIAAAVGTRWVVEHVGSTSVPGLLAKPVIDIAIRVPESEHLTPRVPAFRDLGWTDPLSIGNHQAMFLLDGRVRSAIAHVFTAEQWPPGLTILSDRRSPSGRDSCAELPKYAHAGTRDVRGVLGSGPWTSSQPTCGTTYSSRATRSCARLTASASTTQGGR